MPTKQEVLDLEVVNLADNTSGGITPGDVRQVVESLVDFAEAHVPLVIPDNTPVRIDSTNFNNGWGGSVKTLQIGSTDAVVDAGLNYSKGAALFLTQKVASNNANPTYALMSSPDTGTPNGMMFYGFGANGKVRPVILTRSNYGETNGDDTGLSIIPQMAEKAGVGCAVFYLRGINFYHSDPTTFANGKNQYYAGVRAPFTDAKTWLFQYDNYNIPKVFGFRVSGDVHMSGAVYNSILITTGDFALSLDKAKYKHTGAAANCALPDPTDADNLGRSHKIMNHGTGVITFTGWPIWTDATTQKTTLNYVASDNVVNIVCDGTKWIAE